MASAGLASFYGQVADEVGHPGREAPELIPAPLVIGAAVPRHSAPGVDGTGLNDQPHPHLLWVQDHLHHLSRSAQAIAEPALHLAEIRRRPWWR
jgi:hypothetical protein